MVVINANEIKDRTNEVLVKEVARNTAGIIISTYDDNDFWLLEGWRETEAFMRNLIYTIAGSQILETYYPDGYLEDGNLKDNNMCPGEVPEQIAEMLGTYGLDGIDFEDMLPIGEDYGFTDEFAECNKCNNIVRIFKERGTADHFRVDEGLFCYRCVDKYQDIENMYIDYLTTHGNDNNSISVNTMLTEEQIRKYGFINLSEAEKNKRRYEFNAGLYRYNDNDKPKEQLAEFEGKYKEIIFDRICSNPYQISWRIWVKK